MRIVLGVSGGIAAYKAVLLLRLLREAGHDVHVVPTASALKFVGAPTWAALSGHPVAENVFDHAEDVPHVRLGQEADLVIVAPATADLLARAATGRADDLLTSTLLTARCPVVLAPAMHTEMWENPATVANVATLRSRGVQVIEPASGRLTGSDTGPGRLPEPLAIMQTALAACAPGGDLTGRRVVISAGGTREPIDPVRFIGNRSSGRQGIALATAARDRGGHVTLVAANLDPRLAVEGFAQVVHVESTAELELAVRRAARQADVVVMAAAVADFRPARTTGVKIKKSAGPPPSLELVENPDVLAGLARERSRPDQVVVGFAAETGDGEHTVLELGQAKARRKGADLMAINAVGDGKGFAVPDNDVTIVDGRGEIVASVRGSKRAVADGIWDVVVKMLTPMSNRASSCPAGS